MVQYRNSMKRQPKKKPSDQLCVGEVCAPRDVVDMLGWLGTFSILAAYATASFGLIIFNGPLYQGLNLFGALGIIMSSLPRKAYQATILNLCWTAIAIVTLLRIIIQR